MELSALDADQARDAATTELAKPEYDEARSLTFEMSVLIGRLTQGVGAAGNLTTWIVTGVVITVLVLLLAVVFSRVSWRRSSEAATTDDFNTLSNTVLTVEDAIAAASQADADADYEASVRWWFRALALQTAPTASPTAVAAWTATEVASHVAARYPSCAADAQLAAATFNAMAYGHRPATADHAAFVRRAFQALHTHVRQHHMAAAEVSA